LRGTGKPMVVLGIETSCDETSAAIVIDGAVRSNSISSQLVHSLYGGVVPELASRAHQRLITAVVDRALADAGVRRDQITGIAATYGPGLVGALLVGLNFGKALAYGLDVPFVGVNHMEGHLYSNFLDGTHPDYPFLSLIVSGGHTMLVAVDAPFRHRLLGQTRDDAAGEAFDKVSKMLGLGYPGGPVIDRYARDGNPEAIRFPRSYLDAYEFSFSGIKTSVLYYLRREGYMHDTGGRATVPPEHIPDICASFQAAVVDVLVRKTIGAAGDLNLSDIALAGGVSANSLLRDRMSVETRRTGRRLFFPRMEYCMDNGAMIAYVGWLRLGLGETADLELQAVANLEII